ncbi:LPS export ABC transporter periplasmic protein LptC [Desertivirga arenae]|uniref:LPS export ABC transporter periplasmic protein LptC n=1 Tax=Desertivirga arenae TaxID=2810309 RepID=UPI001A96F135|nr:LPS export ABC transporter periplasmic protein LptC [Pedobacter sp. SYSU D00823]
MKNFIFIACIFSLLLLSACENDLKDVERIASNKTSVPVDKSSGVTIIYSDSAVVKGKLITPELNNYTEQKRYEMPKGLTIIFYDDKQEESSRVVADYGIRYETEKRVELRKNVVVTNVKGDVFKSEELIWDESKRMFYSNQLVNIIKQDGTNIKGSGFRSDENFDNPIIDRAYGDIMTGDKLN